MNRNKAAELLDAYTKFLLKSGYVDDDVWCEGKTTIDQFMETKWFKDNYPFIPTDIKKGRSPIYRKDFFDNKLGMKYKRK